MTETEIKLPVANVAAMRRLLRRLGWRVSVRRHLEHNLVFDRPDGSLLAAGSLLRLRSSGKLCLLTVKRPLQPSALHKVREEFEIETTDTASAAAILGALDYQVSWRYENTEPNSRDWESKARSCSTKRRLGTTWNSKGTRGGSTRRLSISASGRMTTLRQATAGSSSNEPRARRKRDGTWCFRPAPKSKSPSDSSREGL